MQKFGLDSIYRQKHSVLEFEIIKEQATALGITGRKLQQSIDEYNNAEIDANNPQYLEDLTTKVAENVRSLILQREFVGFIYENIDWIKKNYNVPQSAWKKLGY